MIKCQVSVVMPLYNKELEVGRAIRSVLAQSFTDFELIIVNDGSTDASVERARSFADARVRFVSQENQGVSAARNRGVAESKSDLVAFIDADDEWLPGFLKTILTLVEKYPDAGVFATSYLMRDSLGRSRTPILRGLDKGFSEGILSHYFQLAARSDPPVWSSAVAVKRSALISVGGFPAGIRNGEDLLTWARLAAHYSIAYSTEPLSVFWMPADVSRRIGRFDDLGDPVGVQLEGLCGTITGSQRKEFRSYLANWHRMRAVTFLRLGGRSACLKSILRVLTLGGVNLQIVCVAILVFLPKPWVLFKLFKSVLEAKRAWSLHDIYVDLKTCARLFLRRHPFFLGVYFRVTPKLRAKLVTRTTDVVIEGFPRSGNTFLTAAFVFANKERPIKIASHLHSELQILNGIKYGTPCIVIIRRPIDAILSLVIREPTVSVNEAIDMYSNFYSALIPHKNKFVVASFDDVVADVNMIIRKVNIRYSTDFYEIESLSENTGKIFSLIDEMGKVDSKDHKIRMTHVARPDDSRDKIKAEKIKMLEKYKFALADADDVYRRFLDLK